MLSGGGALDAKWTRLKTSSRPVDRGREGVELEIGGGRYKEGEKKMKQKAVIVFLCDKSSEERQRAISRRDNEEEGGQEDNKRETTDDGKGGKLSFTSYEMVGDDKVLSLEWHTKYACENAQEDGEKSSGGHWGFFTWLIIM